jgi:hypothetical protein
MKNSKTSNLVLNKNGTLNRVPFFMLVQLFQIPVNLVRQY